jgi:hypothetical protein
LTNTSRMTRVRCATYRLGRQLAHGTKFSRKSITFPRKSIIFSAKIRSLIANFATFCPKRSHQRERYGGRVGGQMSVRNYFPPAVLSGRQNSPC